jgi:hypothetical protein
MKKSNYLLLLLIAGALFISSCGKDGAVGPKGTAGATGATGAKGATGPAGPAGQNGQTGTANVIYSDWITPSSDSTATIGGVVHIYYQIPATQITGSILNKGTIIVYAKLTGYSPSLWRTGQVGTLPITIAYNGNEDIWSAFASGGMIRIDFINNLNTYTNLGPPFQDQFRYVIIPGGVAASAAINFKDYNQLKAALHLKD